MLWAFTVLVFIGATPQITDNVLIRVAGFGPEQCEVTRSATEVSGGKGHAITPCERRSFTVTVFPGETSAERTEPVRVVVGGFQARQDCEAARKTVDVGSNRSFASHGCEAR